jgi:hypothetical protein
MAKREETREKYVTRKTIVEMTFEELVEMAAHRVHSALLEGGGREMKRTLHLWMDQAIIWQQEQK